MKKYYLKPKQYSLDYNYKSPINENKEWSYLFKKDEQEQYIALGVRKLKNVFVSYYGLVLNKFFLVKSSAPNTGFIQYKDENFYRSHWRLIFEQYLVCKFGNSLESIHLTKSKKYLLLHSPWFSYYFWISECIPRLLSVKDKLDDLVLIYPEEWDDFPFVKETLSLFPELKTQKVESGVHLFIPNLILPEVKPWTPMFIPDLVLKTKELLEGYVNSLEMFLPKYERIYISRKKAARRKFLDEEKIESFLSSKGFKAVVMEDYTFAEQIFLMMNAKVVCGITGAGHINSMFMKKGTYFFDFTNIGYKKSNIYKFHYHKLCNIVSVNYLVQFFDYKEEPTIHKFSQQPLVPDYELLSENLNLIK